MYMYGKVLSRVSIDGNLHQNRISGRKINYFFPHLALQPNSDLGRLHETFRFTSVTRSRTVGRTPWTGNQLVARPLLVHKHRKTHSQHKNYTSIP
jgi:hypothetical protein